MLKEGDVIDIKSQRPVIRPLDIKEQIPWAEAKGVAVLVLNGAGQHNQLFLSDMSMEQLTFLSKQLDSHITSIMGTMKEGF